MSRSALVPRQLDVGPFRGSAAVAAGLVTWAMLKSRAWRRLLPDVYVATAAYASGDHRMWCSAAALAIPPGAALGGWSAAYLHGVDVLPQDARVWINLPVPGRMRPRRRLAVHRTPMRPHELDGYGDIPVTIPLRTAFDLGRRLPRIDALVAVDAMCHRLLTLDQLARHAAERDGWPGIQQLREVILLSDPLAESPMESRTRLLLHDGGAPPVVAQYEVRTASGRLVARLDLAYPRWRIGIEYEGDHHRDRDQFRSDIARHNELREMGWLILHFTADDVLRHPDRLLRQVTAAVHHRRWLLRPSTGTPWMPTRRHDRHHVPLERHREERPAGGVTRPRRGAGSPGRRRRR